MDYAGRSDRGQLAQLRAGVRDGPHFRHLEARAGAATRTSAWRIRHRRRRHDGGSLRRAGSAPGRPVPSILDTAMAFRKTNDSRPQISEVSPYAAIPGGEFQIRGKGLAAHARPNVRFGDMAAPVVIGSDSFVIVRVPEGASGNEFIVGNDQQSAPWACGVGTLVADSG